MLRLRATVLEIEDNEEILVNEIETLVKEKSEVQEKNDELASKVDCLYSEIDEKSRVNSSLQRERTVLQDKLEAECSTHSRNLE